jgi:putative redox protein
MNKHQISTSFITKNKFIATIDNHQILMDAPEEFDISEGASPKKLMLASLAGCTGIDVVSILKKMRVEFSDLAIDVEANLTDEHPRVYNEVFIKFSIKISANDHEKMEKAVYLSRTKYCGVSAMFEKFAKINWIINYT